MKTIILLLATVFCIQLSQAQLKTTPICPTFDVDVLEGTVNELHPFATPGQIQKKFPCFTNVVEETNGSTCGGVFYKDKDISFFTERDYIELGEKYKGKISLPLFGASRGSLFKWLGNPKIKDISWDAFETKYGILILYYNKAGKINKLQMSNIGAESLKLCD